MTPSIPKTPDGESLHQPRIFLSTRIVQAGCDMIELIGELKGESRGEDDFEATSWAMTRLRDAVNRASAALANYDRAIAEGRELMTSAEFEAIIKTGVQKSTSEEFVAARGGV